MVICVDAFVGSQIDVRKSNGNSFSVWDTWPPDSDGSLIFERCITKAAKTPAVSQKNRLTTWQNQSDVSFFIPRLSSTFVNEAFTRKTVIARIVRATTDIRSTTLTPMGIYLVSRTLTILGDENTSSTMARKQAATQNLLCGPTSSDFQRSTARHELRWCTKQSDPLSSLLFFVLQMALEDDHPRWQKKRGMGLCLGDNYHDRFTNMRFADDVLLFSSSKEQRQNMLCKFKRSTEKVGLRIHPGKTKILNNQSSNIRK